MINLTHIKKKTLFVLFVALLALFSISSSFAARPDGSSPDQALTPGSEQTVNGGESLWYVFHYGRDVDGNPVDVSVWLDGYPNDGTNFEVWTPERRQQWLDEPADDKQVEPIGRGSANDNTPGDKYWTSKPTHADKYYVHVKNDGLIPNTHVLHVKGDTVWVPKATMDDDDMAKDKSDDDEGKMHDESDDDKDEMHDESDDDKDEMHDESDDDKDEMDDESDDDKDEMDDESHDDDALTTHPAPRPCNLPPTLHTADASRPRPPAPCISVRWSPPWALIWMRWPTTANGCCAWKMSTRRVSNPARRTPFCGNWTRWVLAGAMRSSGSMNAATPTHGRYHACATRIGSLIASARANKSLPKRAAARMAM